MPKMRDHVSGKKLKKFCFEQMLWGYFPP